MATQKYTEGGITYENRDGQIYKDGRLIPQSSYQYIPSAVGGTRADSTAPASTAAPSGGQTYAEGGINYTNVNGQIYKDGRLIPQENYGYIPSAIGGTRDGAAVLPALTNQTPTTQTAITPQNNNQDIMQAMQAYFAQQQEAQRLAAMNQLTGQTSALERQRVGITQQAQQQRIQADTAAQQDARRIREFMASRGLGSSGENITANVNLAASRQNAFNQIGMDESGRQNDISQRVADLQVANQGDLAQMQATLAAEQAKAMWGQMNTDRSFNWQTDPMNPTYQSQLLNNQIAQLELQNLPQTQALQLQALKQQIANGQIDAATAQTKLYQLQTGSSPLSVSEQNALKKQQEAEYQTQADNLIANISYQFGATYRDKYAKAFDTAATEQKNWKRAILQYVNQLASSGTDPAIIDLVLQNYGISDAEALELLGG